MNPYDKLCNDCASEKGGECWKLAAWYNECECVCCGQVKSCLSVRDYRFPTEEKE